jgi:hypothetical protein
MRCPNGTRKNKQGDCIAKAPKVAKPSKSKSAPKIKAKRCPNGTRKNKQGDCIAKVGPITVVKPVTPKAVAKKVTPKAVAKKATPANLEKIASRIQLFMNRTKQKRREMYLKSICSEAGLCFAFGIESVKIKDFFIDSLLKISLSQ